MIMSVSEFRQFVETDETDAVLEAKLKGIENLIRAYTHNDFRVRGTTCEADIVSGKFIAESSVPYIAGDTVMVNGSVRSDGLYTVKEVNGEVFQVNERLHDDIDVHVSLVQYPEDIKTGVVNMMTWELQNRVKAGIESETISRHTVNYINLDAWNARIGFPASLTHFLNPYMKGRFGRGIGV